MLGAVPGDDKEAVPALSSLQCSKQYCRKQRSKVTKTMHNGDTTRGCFTSSIETTGSSSSDTLPCLGQVGGRVLREGF